MTSALVILISLLAPKAQAQWESAFGGSDPAPKAHFAVVGGYRLPSIHYSADNSDLKSASGTGFHGGIEMMSSSAWPDGLWSLGLYYFTEEIRLEPNSHPEKISVQGLELPLMWGYYLNRRFLFSLGASVKYGLDPLTRTSDTGTKALSHSEYGITAVQTQGLASLRYFHFIFKKPRLFLDIRYQYGIFDRATGDRDQWKEQNTSASLGFYY